MDVIPAGPARRRWSAEAKTRIIASSFEPGANIAEIARTHGLLPQQLYAWRHDSIPGKRLASKKLGFVPAVVEDAGGSGPADGGGDEIVIARQGWRSMCRQGRARIISPVCLPR
jgi:transposase